MRKSDKDAKKISIQMARLVVYNSRRKVNNVKEWSLTYRPVLFIGVVMCGRGQLIVSQPRLYFRPK